MTKVKIPESIKSGENLVVEIDEDAENFFVAVYESPRASFAKEDKEQKNPIWKGDVYAFSEEEMRNDTKITIPMIRGSDSKPALYGRYLVKVWVDDQQTMKIIEVTP